MALFLWQQAEPFAPVYRPVVWSWVSDNYPVAGGYFTDAILGIRQPTTEELDTYQGLSADDVLMDHAPLGITYYNNSLFKFSGVTGYDGTWRVVRILSDQLMVISAPFNGAVSGGNLELTYGNYTMFAEVTTSNGTSTSYAVKPVFNSTLGRWELTVDIRDFLARSFKDVKELIGTSDSLITNAEGYISMMYNISVTEGWDVVDALGGITFERTKGDRGQTFKGLQCTNIVQPYHQTERDGSVTLDWQDTLEDYIRQGIIGEEDKRFLTYLPRDGKVTVRDGDAFYLAWLYDGGPKVMAANVTFLNAAGSPIAGTLTLHGNPGGDSIAYKSNILNVGPSAFTMPAGTAKYLVTLFVNPNNGPRQISESFYFSVVPCKGINKRWYYLNKLGGVDAFTFEDQETRQMSVRREVISKPTMPTAFNNNEWQTRVWRVEPQRKYTITSGYLQPVMLRRIAEDMFESPNIFTEIRPGWWTNVIPLTGDVPGDSDSARQERFVVQYQLGVDNQTQRT